ncbi:MAG: LysM peptidoglycan-binding domain-containing protein [Kiritimatiellae bacterium]|nr:LysM peptidoglycan-binding domain-containing protein [Kiritimatiellia bacterium]
MKKCGLILGVTAVTAFVGCLDPKYANNGGDAEPTPVNEPTPVAVPDAPEHDVAIADTASPFEVTVAEPDPAKPTGPAVAPATPAKPTEPAPETTEYIIQRGDTVSGISARYNIRQDAILAANPQIKDVNRIRLGQKIKLPGKVAVGEQTVPEGAFKKAEPKTSAKPLTGATATYTVQPGDFLGKIAANHGCTVAQLKELNGMTKDTVYVGKTIKVPAAGAGNTKVAPVKPVKPVAGTKTQVVKPVEKTAEAEPEPAASATEPAAPAEPAAPVEPPVQALEEYEVGEGEDIANIAILYNVRPNEIRQINNLPDDAVLTPGMKIKLPAGALLQ